MKNKNKCQRVDPKQEVVEVLDSNSDSENDTLEIIQHPSQDVIHIVDSDEEHSDLFQPTKSAESLKELSNSIVSSMDALRVVNPLNKANKNKQGITLTEKIKSQIKIENDNCENVEIKAEDVTNTLIEQESCSAVQIFKNPIKTLYSEFEQVPKVHLKYEHRGESIKTKEATNLIIQESNKNRNKKISVEAKLICSDVHNKSVNNTENYIKCVKLEPQDVKTIVDRSVENQLSLYSEFEETTKVHPKYEHCGESIKIKDATNLIKQEINENINQEESIKAKLICSDALNKSVNNTENYIKCVKLEPEDVKTIVDGSVENQLETETKCLDLIGANHSKLNKTVINNFLTENKIIKKEFEPALDPELLLTNPVSVDKKESELVVLNPDKNKLENVDISRRIKTEHMDTNQKLEKFLSKKCNLASVALPQGQKTSLFAGKTRLENSANQLCLTSTYTSTSVHVTKNIRHDPKFKLFFEQQKTDKLVYGHATDLLKKRRRRLSRNKRMQMRWNKYINTGPFNQEKAITIFNPIESHLPKISQKEQQDKSVVHDQSKQKDKLECISKNTFSQLDKNKDNLESSLVNNQNEHQDKPVVYEQSEQKDKIGCSSKNTLLKSNKSKGSLESHLVIKPNEPVVKQDLLKKRRRKRPSRNKRMKMRLNKDINTETFNQEKAITISNRIESHLLKISQKKQQDKSVVHEQSKQKDKLECISKNTFSQPDKNKDNLESRSVNNQNEYQDKPVVYEQSEQKDKIGFNYFYLTRGGCRLESRRRKQIKAAMERKVISQSNDRTYETEILQASESLSNMETSPTDSAYVLKHEQPGYQVYELAQTIYSETKSHSAVGETHMTSTSCSLSSYDLQKSLSHFQSTSKPIIRRDNVTTNIHSVSNSNDNRSRRRSGSEINSYEERITMEKRPRHTALNMLKENKASYNCKTTTTSSVRKQDIHILEDKIVKVQSFSASTNVSQSQNDVETLPSTAATVISAAVTTTNSGINGISCSSDNKQVDIASTAGNTKNLSATSTMNTTLSSCTPLSNSKYVTVASVSTNTAAAAQNRKHVNSSKANTNMTEFALDPRRDPKRIQNTIYEEGTEKPAIELVLCKFLQQQMPSSSIVLSVEPVPVPPASAKMDRENISDLKPRKSQGKKHKMLDQRWIAPLPPSPRPQSSFSPPVIYPNNLEPCHFNNMAPCPFVQPPPNVFQEPDFCPESVSNFSCPGNNTVASSRFNAPPPSLSVKPPSDLKNHKQKPYISSPPQKTLPPPIISAQRTKSPNNRVSDFVAQSPLTCDKYQSLVTVSQRPYFNVPLPASWDVPPPPPSLPPVPVFPITTVAHNERIGSEERVKRKFEVLILSDREKGIVHVEELEQVKRYLVTEMLRTMIQAGPEGPELQFSQSVIVKPGWFSVVAENDVSFTWLLNGWQLLTLNNVTFRPVKALEVAKICFSLAALTVDLKMLLSILFVQNRSLKVNKWIYLETTGQPEAWTVIFLITSEVSELLKKQGWMIYYEMEKLAVTLLPLSE